MVRLHGFCQSGNTFKVAFLLNALGQPWQAQYVDFMNGATRDPAWRAQTNEMGEAPVLDDGDLRLTQSAVILEYLADRHGRFGARDAAHRREILRWMYFDNHKFTSYFATSAFIVGDEPTIADFSLSGYLFFPREESGLDLAAQFPSIAAWVQRLRDIPGWADPYELLPGERIAPRW